MNDNAKDSGIFHLGRPLVLDGALGTMLQAAGLAAGQDPADWNVERPEEVRRVHAAYVDAGADVVSANTFGLNRLKYVGEHDLAKLVREGVRLAREASPKPHLVAIDVGPTGRLLAPAGDLAGEEARAAFAETIRLGIEAGADLVLLETFGDVRELKCAVAAAREACDRRIIATVALGEDGRLLTGASVECVAALLESLDVDAYGFNCGLGPDLMLPFVERLCRVATKPIVVKPNAGLPRVTGGRTTFDIGEAEFADCVGKLVAAGASVIGGCCGTTPGHIRAIASLASAPRAKVAAAKSATPATTVSSGSEVVTFRPHGGTIVGERINPTGKKRLREAYRSGDVAYVLREAVSETDAGAKVLDVNCGVPGLDERTLLVRTIAAVESVSSAPIQIDTADALALEDSLRAVNGKPLVNSVNGKRESMDAVFPLVRRYGGAIVALCLDEGGIPPTAAGRLEIARRILAEGERYGFGKDDFLFDALTLAVSADANAALVTLETVRLLTDELGVNTILGVSNVSFGLPNRAALNAAMYTLAVRAGLSAAIYNPAATRECDDELAYDVLLARDTGCARWIAHSAEVEAAAPQAAATAPGGTESVREAIVRGLATDARTFAAGCLAGGTAPMELVQSSIVPALETVGKGFESGRVYLPQLLMAADAAGAAFEAVRSALGPGSADENRPPVVLATVRGDIHDIGKNIVRALLENYGFRVIDLGRDIEPERIVEAARSSGAFLVGLSALMTTTVGAMAETIRLLKAAKLECRTCVGGAVVTADYAAEIGADYYAKDAMRTVRIAEELSGK